MTIKTILHIKPVILICASIAFFFLLSPFTSIRAQELPLSETATASVLTCGPGNDFYTTFGHSALRITDTARGIDWVYNYGTFDFNTSHFYWKFTRGRLDYCLARESFSDFMFVYQYEQRAVWEQRINFTPQEINNLYLMLEWNNQPENKYYKYDFFRDNCATRVRDMVTAAAAHRDIEYLWTEENTISYRGLISSCLKDTLEWWRLGIDILFGLPADHRCSTEESMFLPEEMMSRYEYACLVDRQKTAGRLADEPVSWLSDTREPLHRSFPPIVAFSLLFLVVAILSFIKKWPHWADRVLFILAGLVGIFLLFMWFGTDHWCTKWNLNLLWASPLLILIAIKLDRSPRWALWLQQACFLVAAGWVIVCGLSTALLPITILLVFRLAMNMTKKA